MGTRRIKALWLRGCRHPLQVTVCACSRLVLCRRGWILLRWLMGEAWKSGEALPRDGHFHGKENKRCFSKHTIYFGRSCQQTVVLRGGRLLGLGGFSCGWSGRREQGKGNWSMHIQASAGLRCAAGEEGCSHGAGAIWEDTVGPRW